MNTNFDRLFQLAKKSKSPLVVLDKQTENQFVVLGIDDYESLLDQEPVAPSSQKPPVTVTPEPVATVSPVVMVEQKNDPDREQDALLLQKINQQIADWRAEEQKKVVATEVQVEPVVVSEPEFAPEPLPEPLPEVVKSALPIVTQPVTIPVKIVPESTKNSSWHKLGDVMAGNFTKVSYESLGEQGLKPTVTEEVSEYAEPEPLNDDPVFLEEPLG